MNRHATSPALAAAALSLLGAPFQLHGRDPLTGLDCAGLLEAALKLCAVDLHLPRDYSLRTRVKPDLATPLGAAGIGPAAGPVLDGDILLVRPAPCQHHVAIVAGAGRIVHAHAGLRRVVHSPLPRAWPILGRWRVDPYRS